MKKNILRLFTNIFISIIVIIVLFNFGISNKLGFDDTKTSKNSIILTTNGNLEVTEIKGVNVEGKLIRVENEKLYKTVVFLSQNEYVALDSFIFSSPFTDSAYSISYESEEDQIYLDRDFSIIKGYQTISLLMILILVFQSIFYLAFIMSLINNRTEKNDSFECSKYIRIMEVQPLLVSISIIIVSLFAYLIDFSEKLFIFLYKLTDNQIIYIIIFYIIILLSITGFKVFKQNYKFEFLDESLNLKKKNKLIFSSPYKDLIVDEVVMKASTARQNFVKMNLILSSKGSNIPPINVDFKFMEYEDFTDLVEKLHSLEERDDVKSLKIRSDEELVLFARKEDNLFLYSGFFLVLLVLYTLFTKRIFDVLNSIQLMIVFTVFLIPYFFFAFRAIIRKPKEFRFLINKSGIKINEELIHFDEIKKIKMTKPTLYNTNNKILKIRKMIGREKYIISHSLFKSEIPEDKKNYEELYLTIKDNFNDILN